MTRTRKQSSKSTEPRALTVKYNLYAPIFFKILNLYCPVRSRMDAVFWYPTSFIIYIGLRISLVTNKQMKILGTNFF